MFQRPVFSSAFIHWRESYSIRVYIIVVAMDCSCRDRFRPFAQITPFQNLAAQPPNKNSFPSPDDDTNLDDALPLDLEHFPKFQTTSCSSFHIHLHIVLLVFSNFLSTTETACRETPEVGRCLFQKFSGSFSLFTFLVLK